MYLYVTASFVNYPESRVPPPTLATPVQGEETEIFRDLKMRAARIQQQEAEAEAKLSQLPSCTMEWKQDIGGKVWCEEGRYPRIARVPVGDAFKERCLCFESPEVDANTQRLYENCDLNLSECPLPA